MYKHNHFRLLHCLILFIIGILTQGCTFTPYVPQQLSVDGIQPIWGTKLPGKAGIYNLGLIGLPIYDGNVIFHSTYFSSFSNNVMKEDNRIHGLDVKTGEVKWTFPTEYSSTNSMCFWGVPYIFNEYMVVKMWSNFIFLDTDKLLCINLNTHQEVWQRSLPNYISSTSTGDVVGKDHFFYFVQESKFESLIYKGNIVTGDTTLLLQLKPEAPLNCIEVSGDQRFYTTDEGRDLLIFGLYEHDYYSSDTPYKTYCCVFDIESGKVLIKKLITRNDGYLLGQFEIVDNRVYMTCGRVATCLDLKTGDIIWQFFSDEYYNYAAPRLSISDGVVFLSGENRFIGLNALTGSKLYQGDLQCGNSTADKGFVYVMGRDVRLHILNIHNGYELHVITCPERVITGTGFVSGGKPQVHGDKLFVWGNYHAYCYDAIPKE
jgi:outer membrane protein assembly factor BamB